MRDEYELVEMEVISFDGEDVIVTSGGDNLGGGGGQD